MAPVSGTNSVYASVLSGLQGAQARALQAAQSLSPAGASAPVDSAEFSDAALAASPDSIAGAAITLSQAKTETAAMVLLAKAEDKMQKQTLDLLA
jgi:hypothetical protein